VILVLLRIPLVQLLSNSHQTFKSTKEDNFIPRLQLMFTKNKVVDYNYVVLWINYSEDNRVIFLYVWYMAKIKSYN
jgi:hypothetical protein